jgi:hypothetical protein
LALESIQGFLSLPALMKLLGHKDIRTTLRDALVTQQDLQREFHQARQNAVHPHHLPTLSLSKGIENADVPSIRQALAVTRHLLECIAASWTTRKPRAGCGAWIDDSWLSLHNWIESPRQEK